MTYLLKTDPPHHCDLPRKPDKRPAAHPGSIWRCDVCGRLHMVEDTYTSFGYDWHQISERRARKLLRKANA